MFIERGNLNSNNSVQELTSLNLINNLIKICKTELPNMV